MQSTGATQILKAIGWMALLFGTVGFFFYLINGLTILNSTASNNPFSGISTLSGAALIGIGIASLLIGALYWALCLVLATIAESTMQQAYISSRYLPRIARLLKRQLEAQEQASDYVEDYEYEEE